MNKILDFNVTGQSIELASAAMLVAGTINEYTARFSFSADWDGYQRLAVFNADGTEREQLLTDDTCKVPWEVLLPGAYLKVGVYGTKDGSRLPTIWTSHRQYIHDGAGPTDEAADPSPVLAEQILHRMGDLGALKTEDKSSLVAAINEVKETGGGGGTSDHSKLVNRDATDQHPMSAITGLEQALEGKQPTGNYLTKELDPTVPEWAKQTHKPAYTAQEVGALPDTTKIPSALSELSEDATHRVVTDAEKAAWNAKSNFTGSYNDLTDKPVIPTVPVQSVNGKTGAVVLSADDVGALPASTVIPAPYTLPIASSTVLGGVQPVAKTDAMTQSVGVDAAGGLWAPPGGGGGGAGGGTDTVLMDVELTEDVNIATVPFTDEMHEAIMTADVITVSAEFIPATTEGVAIGNFEVSVYGNYTRWILLVNSSIAKLIVPATGATRTYYFDGISFKVNSPKDGETKAYFVNMAGFFNAQTNATGDLITTVQEYSKPKVTANVTVKTSGMFGSGSKFKVIARRYS